MMKKIRFFYTALILPIQNRSQFEPGLPSPVFAAMPLLFLIQTLLNPQLGFGSIEVRTVK